MSVYIVAQLNIHDRDRYSEYESGFMAIFSRYKGRVLAVDESTETLEGEWAFTRTVVIEFPSDTDAKAWFHSEAYQALADHRRAASDGNIVLIKGFD